MICLEIPLLKGTLCADGSHHTERVICHTAGNEFSLWIPASTVQQLNPHTPVHSELRLSQACWEEHSNTILEKTALLQSGNMKIFTLYKEQKFQKDGNTQQTGSWGNIYF